MTSGASVSFQFPQLGVCVICMYGFPVHLQSKRICMFDRCWIAAGALTLRAEMYVALFYGIVESCGARESIR